MRYSDKNSIVRSGFTFSPQQGCVYGLRFKVEIWTDQYYIGILEQLEAQLMGWA